MKEVMTIRDCLFATSSSMIRNRHLFLIMGILNRHRPSPKSSPLPNQGLVYKHQHGGQMFYSYLVEKVEESRSDSGTHPDSMSLLL